MNLIRSGDTSAIASVLAIALLSVGKLSAGVLNIYGSAAPTPGLTGYTTYTLSMQTDVADVGGLDFLGGPAVGDFGFFGPMHHVQPSDVSTIFRDYNGMFDVFGQDSRQDSQFLFSSTDLLSIRPSESENSLHAAFAGFDSFGTDFNFAQIVVPDGQEVTFRGQVAFRTPKMDLPAQDFTGVVGAGLLFESEVVWPLPEIVVEPEPTPPPVPAQPPVVPPLPPEPVETDPLPELEIPPNETEPIEPPPLDPDEQGSVEIPFWKHPVIPIAEGSIRWLNPLAIDLVADPDSPTLRFIMPGELLLYGNRTIDEDFTRSLGSTFNNFGPSNFMAFDGNVRGFGQESNQQVPEPTAIVQWSILAGIVLAMSKYGSCQIIQLNRRSVS